MSGAPPEATGLTSRRWWPRFRRVLTLLFFTAVAWLLLDQARAIHWHEVFSSLASYPLTSLLGAAALAALSLALYSCFDLLGRHYTGHTLRTPTVMLVTFTSYVLNLNLGSLVGGVALRYRLYSRLGLEVGVITRVMSLSMLTNWMGYLLLAGLLFTFHAPALPPTWAITSQDLQLMGGALLAIAVAYLLLCAFSGRRSITVRGQVLSLPSAQLALLQVGMGAANWLTMGGVVYLLLQQKIDYVTVVSVLLVAAVAGVLTHVPAGLGVLEAVFVSLLAHQMPRSELLASLVAYRVMYYLVPLVVATTVFLIMETRARQRALADGSGPSATPQPAHS